MNEVERVKKRSEKSEENLKIITEFLHTQGYEIFDASSIRVLESGLIMVPYSSTRNKSYIGTFKVVEDKVIEVNRRNVF